MFRRVRRPGRVATMLCTRSPAGGGVEKRSFLSDGQTEVNRETLAPNRTRHRARLWPSLLLIGASVTAVPVGIGAQESSEVPRLISSFGLEVSKSVVADANLPNVVLSPLSVGLALALLAEGASGETRIALENALAVPSGDWASFGHEIGTLLDDLNGDTTATIRIANAVWADTDLPLAAGFAARAEQDHQASVRVADLQAPSTHEQVNEWAKEQTNGRIEDAMPPVDEYAEVLLLNAVYFNGLWQEAFDSARTEPAPFARARGDTISVPMMAETARFGHFDHQGHRGLRIPYQTGRFAAYVVVPDTVPASDVFDELTLEQVDGWPESLQSQSTTLLLPRIETRGKWDLLDALAQAGAPVRVEDRPSFDSLWASPPSAPVGVSGASQATFLKIDEQGTEAAAVTSMEVVSLSDEPTPEFRVDRPFLLVLRDDHTGAVLFVALIGDPTHQGS